MDLASTPSACKLRGEGGVQLSIITLRPTFVQDSIGRLVARQRLLAEVLVRLCEALHLRKARIERHGRVAGVLGHVQVSGPSQLLLDHKRLLQQLTEQMKRK